MEYRHQRRSRSQTRLPVYESPLYRDEYESGGYYFTERPYRSRSLDMRREVPFSDDYGFPSAETNFGQTEGIEWGQTYGKSRRNEAQKRVYDYQPFTISTGYYGGEKIGNEHVAYSPRPTTSSEWDALDRSLRNYRNNGFATVRPRPKPQSVSPVERTVPNVGYGTKEIYSGAYPSNTSAAQRRHQQITSFFDGLRHHDSVKHGGWNIMHHDSIQQPRQSSPTIAEIETGYQTRTNYPPGIHPDMRTSSGPHSTQLSVNPSSRQTAMHQRHNFTDRFPSPEQKYYKVRCCCLSFRWPPWALAETDPPQPMYRH